MVGVSELMGEKEIIFPEMAALTIGMWIVDKKVWTVSRLKLVLLMSIGAIVGAGMRWSRYRIDTNEYFKEIDGVTALRPAPEGVTLKASKLNITSLTIPLLLEWQPKKRSSEFFLSAGVVGVIKTCSSSKIVYNDASGKKHKEKMDSGMNIRPVTMDFLFQAGWDWIGLYAKYSPIDLFENGKGPKVHPVSIGLQLHL